MSALAHSTDLFTSLPYRRGVKGTPDWALCSQYIRANHSSNYTTTIDEALLKMVKSQETIVKTCYGGSDSKSTPNESFIDHTLKPYCVLVAQLMAHLPLHSGHVSKSMKFSWRDSFTDVKYDSQNGNCELVSCVFNLAASYNNVAVRAVQTGSEEGAKKAHGLFQTAAGYFTMVEGLLSRVPPEQLTGGDFRRDSLTLLIALCVAQAHHCAYLKAEETAKNNHGILSKIAQEAGKLYEETHALFKSSAWLREKGPHAKEIEPQLAATAAIFYARACLHVAVQNEKEGEMGVALAYYEKAQHHLGRIPKMPLPAQTSWVNSIINAANAAHEAAEKANNSVYYSRIPKDAPAPADLGRALGKAEQLQSFVDFTSSRGSDPFFGIVPAQIASLASKWRDKQRRLVNVCEQSAASGRKHAEESFQQLGVTATIDAMSGETKDRGRLPTQLRDRITKLRTAPDGNTISLTESIVQHVQACEGIYTVADGKLHEVEAELAAERKADMDFMSAYGEKMWRSLVPPSENTSDYQAIQAAIAEHRNGLQQWLVTPYGVARKSVDDNLRNLARLDWPMADLDALMPYVESKEARQQSSSVMDLVNELKALVESKERVEEEQKTRQNALKEMIESDAVVSGLSSVDPGQRDEVLAKAGREIADAIEAVNVKTREEAELVQRAASIMEQLGTLQSADPVQNEIQTICNGLESACTLYSEVYSDLDSVANYGSQAIDAIDATLSNAKSFAMSRKLEAQERQSMLDEQIAARMHKMEQEALKVKAQQQQQQPAAPAAPSYQYPSGPAVPPPSGGPAYQYAPPPGMAPAGVAPPPPDMPPSYESAMTNDRYQPVVPQQPPAQPGYYQPYQYPPQPM